jgi:hypothetical protein
MCLEYSFFDEYIALGWINVGEADFLAILSYISLWCSMPTKPTKRLLTHCRRIGAGVLGLYVLYLVKSALGINLLPNHSAWRVLKLPIAPIMQARYGKNWH